MSTVIKRVATTMSKLKPNQQFSRPNGKKIFIFETSKKTGKYLHPYVYFYYSEDNPYDERETTNGDKKVDLLIPKS